MNNIIRLINQNLEGKITMLTLEKRLKAIQCNLKAFERGKAQIKVHIVYNGVNKIIKF